MRLEVSDVMISPDGYYEVYLKGKSEKEIRSTIRGLKNEIGRLKNIMEHPDYGSEPLVHPFEGVRIKCNRMYLERAKMALAELGAEYVPPQTERKAQQFQENIDYIKVVRFEIGGCFGGYDFYTISVDDQHIHYDFEHSLMLKPPNLPDMMDYPMTKEEFLDGLRELHIGEWRHYYRTEILDGTQWSLDIEYSNGAKPAHYGGSNSFPYNFSELKYLFGIVEDIDYEEDE